MTDSKEWYNNKELYEMIQRLTIDLKELSLELQETKELITKYNGLRGEIQSLKDKIKAMEEQKTGRSQVWEGIRQWIPWGIAILTLLFRLKGWI